MINDSFNELIKSFEISFAELSEILNVLGNGKRIKILILLINGSQSYSSIVNEVQLKKTAVSNHLSRLLSVGLIQRGDYGIYEITGDGLEFLKAIESAYKNSPSRQIERFQKMERRKISKSFLDRFNV